jgi:hypothetical protein
MGVDEVPPFFPGQSKIDHKDLEAIRLFLTSIRRGTAGVSPIKVDFSEASGFSISIDKESDHLNFTLEAADNLGVDGVIVPTFAGGNGLDSDSNILAEDPPQTYTGAYWTFINQGAAKDGTNKSIVSALDTSKPFVAEVSEAVVSGDWVGVKSATTLLTKDLPGFKVLADMSSIYGDFHALVVRRPLDGMLGKASAAIATDAAGNVKLSLVSGTTQGGDFSATNKGSAVAIGDFVQLGEDADGAAFFKATESGGGAGDVCSSFPIVVNRCWEIGWNQGPVMGSYYRKVQYTLISKASGLDISDCDELLAAIGNDDLEWGIDTETVAIFDLGLVTLSALTPDPSTDTITGTHCGGTGAASSFNFDNNIPTSFQSPSQTVTGCQSVQFEIVDFDSPNNGEVDFDDFACTNSDTDHCCASDAQCITDGNCP